MVEFSDIESARAAIREHVYLTPCAYSSTLSKLAGAKVYLKLENLQMTGSYKERGACNRLRSLGDAGRQRGVIAASAGNHAQGVAYHAQRLGVPATIVMPAYTPLVKVTATRSYGARVVLHGQGLGEAFDRARRIAEDEGLEIIHAYDDPAIVAGQGTVGLELLEQNPYLDAVVVPIGGGGLIAGIALAMKATNPRIRVYGVEVAGMAGMKTSRDAGEVVTVPVRRTLADGIAVPRIGTIPLEIVRRYVDDIVTVDDEEIASAVLTLLEVEKTIVEGAGAATWAAVVNGRLPIEGDKVALVLTGGNIDVTVLDRIIRRGLVKDGRMARLRVLIRDTPGALAELTQLVATTDANVMEIDHGREFVACALGETQVTMTLEARGHAHVKEIVTTLRAAGITVAPD